MKEILYFLKQIQAFAGVQLYINVLGMMIVGLLEGMGTLLLIPMISMSGIVDFGVTRYSFLSFLQVLQSIPELIILPSILGLYIVIVVGQNYLNKKLMIRNTKIQNGFLRKLRLDTHKMLLHTKWNFFIKTRKSDLINLLLSEVTKTSSATNAFLQFTAALITTVIQIGLAFWLSPTITSYVLLCGALLVFMNRKFFKESMALGKRNFELNRVYFAGVTDQLNGIKDIKSNSLEQSRMEWLESITSKINTEQLEYTKLKSTSQFYYKSASAVFIALFIFIALNAFTAQAGQLLLIILIFSRLWPRVTNIQSSLEQIAASIPSFKAVKRLQNECEKQTEFIFSEENNIPKLHLHSAIECRNVSFRYSKNKPRYALQNINITLQANQMTAFVGPSGAGKSTLIDLIMGLNQPEKGQVLLDGTPLTKENLLSLRSSLSYVPQDPFLFHTSIRENLLLVEPNATDEDLWEALSFASAAEFVKKLPDGLDSIIGDRGIKLSGGERQRLVLARAILRKPSILVLDEATSALDTVSEAKIQESLNLLRGKMTIIVIAHRLSTIRNADQVIVLEEGKVVQQGGFNQLSQEKNKLFSRLLGKQIEVLQ